MARDTRGSGLDVHPVVFFGSTGIIVLVLVLSVVATDAVGSFFDAVQRGIVEKLGWLYVLSMTGILVFAVWLTRSRFGAIRLGPDDSKPEFSTPTWFAMLFSAGMGIGLLFFGVAEPIMHYGAPPIGEGHTLEAARNAMGLTLFHWGLHPWALYAVVGLSIGYFGFRRGLPLSIRSTFHPLLGERIHGRLGDAIDILAVVSTLFGVATSLGLGAMQVNAGLHHVAGLPESTGAQVAIITIITVLATASVISGLGAGVRRLSELNMGLATLLLLFVAVVGPTAFLFNAFVENIGTYLQYLPRNSFLTTSFEGPQRRAWLGLWTVFYWAWWIAWAPFVGTFVARISRGRTVREFVVGVLVVPVCVTLVWLYGFGESALALENEAPGTLLPAVQKDASLALFAFLERLPGAEITSVLGLSCVALFFVTSSDSGSFVVDVLTSGGKKDPPVWQRVFWATLEGAIACALLWGGGLRALQSAAIATGLPFAIVLVAAGVGIVKALRNETKA